MSPSGAQDLDRLADRPRLRVHRVDVEVLRHALTLPCAAPDDEPAMVLRPVG